MAGCCGGNGDVIIAAKQRLNLLERPKGEPTVNNGLVRVEFAGDRKGSITYKSVMGQNLSKPYKLGAGALNKYADATPEDARLLVEAEICRYVKEQTIDLAQVDRVSVDIAPQGTAVPEPEPADLAAISEGNLSEFRQSLLNLSKDELGELLVLEKAKDKPRKSAVRLLKATISDMERVASA